MFFSDFDKHPFMNNYISGTLKNYLKKTNTVH